MITFANAVKDGKFVPEDYDLWIDAWHDSGTECELHESLGISFEDYSAVIAGQKSMREALGLKPLGDTQEQGLTIKEDVDEEEQNSNFINATFQTLGRHAVSIAVRLPAAYASLSPSELAHRIAQETRVLRSAGWEFEVQKGWDAECRSRAVDDMIALINRAES